MNNPLKYTDPSGQILKYVAEGREIEFPESNDKSGGGGGRSSKPPYGCPKPPEHSGSSNNSTPPSSGYVIIYIGSSGNYSFTNFNVVSNYSNITFENTQLYNGVGGSGRSSIKQAFFNNGVSSQRDVIDMSTATACEGCGNIGLSIGYPRVGYNPNVNKALEKTSTSNGFFGLVISAAQEFTLAGQALYVTSKGLTRSINFANLTRNSRPYAESFTIMRNFGRASMGIGIGLDYAMYKKGLISKEKFKLNTGITVWGLGIARIGGGTIGLGINALYFGIDTFYPGGWKGAMNDQNNLIQETQSIIGISNMFYKH